MRKLFLSLLVLVAFLSLAVPSVVAVDEKSTTPISYDLPYPGMLPDSPVYFVKVARDRVMRFLISSDVNKSFYSLLLSDKRLGAGRVLIDGGKIPLGVTTIVIGEEFFSEAVDDAKRAKLSGLEVSELLAKLSVAAVKHQEVIASLLPKVSGKENADLDKSYLMSQNSQNRVKELMKSGR